jgi:hypothetical protein
VALIGANVFPLSQYACLDQVPPADQTRYSIGDGSSGSTETGIA